MITFTSTFYVIKGKVTGLELSTGKGFDEDQKADDFLGEISSALTEIVSKNKEVKGNKKVIFFGEADATWLESAGKFKGDVQLTLSSMQHTAAEFKWMDKTSKSFDNKNSVTANPAHVEFMLERMNDG